MGETDETCLFCKIVAGEIASDRVAESPLAYAFRDLNPQAPVHVLVVPKRHEPDIGSLAAADPESTIAVLELARQVAEGENPPPVAGSVPAGGAPNGSSQRASKTWPDALQNV